MFDSMSDFWGACFYFFLRCLVYLVGAAFIFCAGFGIYAVIHFYYSHNPFDVIIGLSLFSFGFLGAIDVLRFLLHERKLIGKLL